MSYQTDYKTKPIYDLYDKLRFDKFECLFGLHHDVGYNEGHKFPIPVTQLGDEITSGFVDPNMTVAVISDTHNYENIDEIIDYINTFNLEYLIHAGDIGSPYMLDKLAKFNGAGVLGVLGNHDKQYAADFLLKMKEINEKDKDKICLKYDRLDARILGHGFYIIHEHTIQPLIDSLTTTSPFIDTTIVFGHIHRPMVFRKEEELIGIHFNNSPIILNPGICCVKKDTTNEVEKNPMFCFYNVKNPLWSVFVRI